MNENEVVVREFRCIDDFLSVNDFLCDTYQLYNGLQNWDIARWNFNRYCVHGKEELEDKRTWEDSVRLWKTVDGDVVGVAHVEEPGEYFFQVHPDYKYLEEEMVEWVLGDNTGKVIIHAKKSDFNRIELFEWYGARKLEHTEYNRVLNLNTKLKSVSLPEGYRFLNLDKNNLEECDRISKLYQRIWPTSSYVPDGETVSSLANSPIFIEDLSFIVQGPDESFIAFCFIWYDPYNKVGHFYPVGFEPEIMEAQLKWAFLETALNTLRMLECDRAYINGYYDEEDNKLFHQIGFKDMEDELSYVLET